MIDFPDFKLTGEPTIKPKTKVNGYYATPGSGPAGETCKTCAHSIKRSGGQRGYWKCKLVKPTAGPGTDIRLKSPACFKWERQHKEGR